MKLGATFFSLLVLVFGVVLAEAQSMDGLTDDEILNRLNDQLRGAKAADRVVSTENGVTTKKLDTPKEAAVYANIIFDLNSSALGPKELSKVLRMCRIIDQIDAQFLIIGHTDASGSDESNKILSKKRAESVKNFFTNECGFEQKKFAAIGMGEEALLETLPANDGKQRRVEFQVLK